MRGLLRRWKPSSGICESPRSTLRWWLPWAAESILEGTLKVAPTRSRFMAFASRRIRRKHVGKLRNIPATLHAARNRCPHGFTGVPVATVKMSYGQRRFAWPRVRADSTCRRRRSSDAPRCGWRQSESAWRWARSIRRAPQRGGALRCLAPGQRASRIDPIAALRVSKRPYETIGKTW